MLYVKRLTVIDKISIYRSIHHYRQFPVSKNIFRTDKPDLCFYVDSREREWSMKEC